MPLHYVIDGYNIVNNRFFAANRKKMASVHLSLLALIKDNRLCGSEKNQVTVVFDGYCAEFESKCAGRGINVIFSKEDTADEKIKHIIDVSADLRNIIIVSDDREIVSFAKYAGCKTMAVLEFMGKLVISADKGKEDTKEKNLSKKDLNYSQISKINEELKRLWLSDKEI